MANTNTLTSRPLHKCVTQIDQEHKIAEAIARLYRTDRPRKENTPVPNDPMYATLVYQGVTYENFEISRTGQLRNKVTGTVYKTWICSGYESVCVSLGSRKNKKLFKIHRCVAESWIPRVQGKEYINHIDGNKINNRVENLEWCTASENTRHAIGIGAMTVRFGEDTSYAKFSNDTVNWIRCHYKAKDDKYGAQALAKFFGVHPKTIYAVVHGKRYARVPFEQVDDLPA